MFKKIIFYPILTITIAIFLAFSYGELKAQQSQGPEIMLEQIDVRATVRREELKTTSATVLTNEDVNNRVYYQPLDMITLSPGVSMAPYAESGTAQRFQIRGFLAGHNAASADITMYMDGIPLHDNGHVTGYVDSNMIMPIEVESVEVIKGPASVYYGQHSAGGTVAVQAIKGGNHNKLQLRYGSHNDIDVMGLIGREGEKFGQIYAFELYHTDGYRAHSEWEKKNFSGRWTYRFSDKLTTSINIRAYQSNWDSAGYVAKSLHDDIYEAVYDGVEYLNGGKRKRYDGRLWANYYFNDETQLTYYLYGTTLTHTRWQVNDPYLVNNVLSGGSGTEQNNTHESWGTGLIYNYDGGYWGREGTATLGLTYMFEKEVPERRWALRYGEGRKRISQTQNRDFTIANPSIFGEITIQALDYLNIRVGARYDWLYGYYQNNVNGDKFTSPKYGFFSPKFGLLVTPLDWMQLYFNFSRGFSVPETSTSASVATDPSSSFYFKNAYGLKTRDQYELGARVNPTDWLEMDFGVFKFFTENDTTYDQENEQYIPTGKTTRQGIEFSFDLHPIQDWHLKGNYAYMDAKYKYRITNNYDYSGHRLTGIPRHITNLELSYAPYTGLGGRLTYRLEADNLSLDDPPVNIRGQPNTNVFKSYKIGDRGFLDLQLNYRITDEYRVLLDVKNILDKHFIYLGGSGYPYAGGDYLYAPLAPRSIYLTLEIDWK